MEYRITERLHGEIEARDTEERYLNTEKQKEVPMQSEKIYKNISNNKDMTILRGVKDNGNNNEHDGRGIQKSERTILAINGRDNRTQEEAQEKKEETRRTDTKFQEGSVITG